MRGVLRLTFIAAICGLLVPAIGYAGGAPRRTLSTQFGLWKGASGPPPPTCAAGFDGNECACENSPTDNGTGGCTFYTKTVIEPTDSNVMLVQLSGAGDLGNTVDNIMWLAATVDDLPCVNGSISQESTDLHPSGWVGLQALAGKVDGSDFPGPQVDGTNQVNFQWCCKVTPGSHTVKLKIATTGEANLIGDNPGGDEVNIQQVVATIDSVGVPAANACSAF